MCTYASSQVKRKSFYRNSELQIFCWFPAAILVHQNGAPIWRLHTMPYKGAWNVSANNSETVGHKDLRLEQIVYILVFYNISFSWLLPLVGFQFVFWVRDSNLYRSISIFYIYTVLFLRQVVQTQFLSTVFLYLIYWLWSKFLREKCLPSFLFVGTYFCGSLKKPQKPQKLEPNFVPHGNSFSFAARSFLACVADAWK